MHIQRHFNIRQQRGFSLIQLSVILAVSAVIIASVLPGKDAGDMNQKTINNIAKLDKVEKAMTAFMSAHGRRPCPADGRYDINNHLFGMEAGSVTPNSSDGSCTGGSPAAPIGPDATGHVVAGTIPTKTLAIPDEDAFDAWGRRFTYVVDTRATSVSACYTMESTSADGGITVEHKDNIGAIAETDYTTYLYISHGQDGHGAFPGGGSTVSGRLNRGSSDPDTLVNAGVDSHFVTSFTNIRVKKDPDAAFDDLVYYHPDTKNVCCIGTSCNAIPTQGYDPTINPSNGELSFGINVITGDINGDGISDLIITADKASPQGRSNAGIVYVIFGSKSLTSLPATLDGTNGFQIYGTAAHALTGRTLAVGDINGDGFQDIIIGAQGNPTGQGGAYVVFGGKNPWPAIVQLSDLAGSTGVNGTNGFLFKGPYAFETSESSLAVGDINGDGVQDLITGDPNIDHTHASNGGYSADGSTYVLFGGTGSWPAIVNVSDLAGNTGVNGTSGVEFQGSGYELSGAAVTAGVFGGNGSISDLVIGAPNTALVPNHGNIGKIYLVYGHTGTWTTPQTLAAIDADDSKGFSIHGDSSFFGLSLAAGDINRSGFDSLVVGGSDGSFGVPTAAPGTVYVFFGSSEGITGYDIYGNMKLRDGNDLMGYKLTGVHTDAIGTQVNVGCDINGDGKKEIMLYAPWGNEVTPGVAYTGKTYVVLNLTPPMITNSNLTSNLTGPEGFSAIGLTQHLGTRGHVTSGDITGSGKCSLIIGETGLGTTLDSVGERADAGGGLYIIPGRTDWNATFDLSTLR